MQLFMLSTMQHFSCDADKFKFERMSGQAIFTVKYLFNCFPFHSMQLIIPGSKPFQEKSGESFVSKGSLYFIVKDVTASELIQPNFLKYFMQEGVLWVTTHNADAEYENFLSIRPPGKLILSLERSIAQCISLNKVAVRDKKNRRNFQTHLIDLSSSVFSPEKKVYKSVLFELKKIDHIQFTLIFKWIPTGCTCPYSLKNYFESQGKECIPYQSSYKHSVRLRIPVPKINFESFDSKEMGDILEWTGAQICGIDYIDSHDSYISKFTIPTSSEMFNTVYIDSWKGFYVNSQVIDLLHEVSEIFKEDTSVPFVIVNLTGYQNCYIDAKCFQQFSSSDKMICIVAFPSSDYWVISRNVRC